MHLNRSSWTIWPGHCAFIAVWSGVVAILTTHRSSGTGTGSVLAGPVHRPNKIPTWTGDQDLQDFNEIMRDELDNTKRVDRACWKTGEWISSTMQKIRSLEDTFLLGPDLIENLKQKRKIMLDHWLDIEDYLTSPFK